MPGCQGVAKRGATVKGILERLLLQHNPDALLAISENGEILHWNDAAEAIFGCIFVTSTATTERDRLHGLALGAAKFLFRPIEPQQLLKEVEDCLAQTDEP
jgi:PAS domain-containing protein